MKFTDNFRTAWNELWFFPVSAEHLGMYRCAFFALSFYLFQSWEFARYAGAEPVLWYPVSFFVFLPQPASPETLEVLAMVWKASLVTSALGFLTRLSTMIAFLLGAYLIGLTHCYGLMRHSDAAFVVGLGILAFARSGDGLSLDSLLGLWRRSGPAPLGTYSWPLRLTQFSWCMVFFLAGWAKVRYGQWSWFAGEVLHDYLIWVNMPYDFFRYSEAQRSINAFLIARPALVAALSVGTVCIELAVVLAFWRGNWAKILVPLAVCMQIGINLSMYIKFYQIIPVYMVWVDWPRALAFLRRSAERVCNRKSLRPG